MTEKEAWNLLCKLRWPDERPRCPKCDGPAVLKEAKLEVRCSYGCRARFNVRARTWLAESKIRPPEWIEIFSFYTRSRAEVTAADLRKKFAFGSWETADSAAERVQGLLAAADGMVDELNKIRDAKKLPPVARPTPGGPPQAISLFPMTRDRVIEWAMKTERPEGNRPRVYRSTGRDQGTD